MEVGGIAVDGLVAAHRKIKRLKRKRFAAVAAAQKLQDLGMQGQLPHRRGGGIAPGIAQAHARIGAAAPFAQIQQRLQLGTHLIQQRQPVGVAGPQQAEALLVQLQCTTAVPAEVPSRYEIQAIRPINPGVRKGSGQDGKLTHHQS